MNIIQQIALMGILEISMTDHAAAAQIARRLDDAERSSMPMASFAAAAGLDINDGYEIQRHWVAQKIASGTHKIGHKIGFTSRGIQRIMRVDHPIYGVLLDTMRVPNQAALPIGKFIQPRVEAEIVLVLGKDLSGTEVTLTEALNAVAGIVPAIEIIDGRVIAPNAIDIIADNAGNAALIMGNQPVAPDHTDLRWISVLLHRNAAIEDSGVSGAVLGHPLLGLIELTKMLAHRGEALRAGEIILAGAFTTPLPVVAGDEIMADYGKLGCLSVRFI